MNHFMYLIMTSKLIYKREYTFGLIKRFTYMCVKSLGWWCPFISLCLCLKHHSSLLCFCTFLIELDENLQACSVEASIWGPISMNPCLGGFCLRMTYFACTFLLPLWLLMLSYGGNGCFGTYLLSTVVSFCK